MLAQREKDAENRENKEIRILKMLMSKPNEMLLPHPWGKRARM